MTVTLISGIIGIGMLLAFVGIMVWWVKALPLIIIFAFCIALLIWDFIRELRSENAGS